MALVKDTTRPGLKGTDRETRIVSRKITDMKDPSLDDSYQKEQLAQLKLIRTHLEIQNDEEIQEDTDNPRKLMTGKAEDLRLRLTARTAWTFMPKMMTVLSL